MYELKVKARFAAAHHLKMVAKKCENLHGHNWHIEVFVTGKSLNEAGVLVDFGVVKTHLREIIETLDHKFLNELEMFSNSCPSSENVARYIADSMDAKIDMPGVRVSRVMAWESDDAGATYIVE
ncbi:MAG: 6-carboxytetrahydropterin synthase QueD [Deltaproteobacteria bacterium]|nr:6-carboxytetrahydropterin synthase QueD [Deltaproteobacteria bacterium]